MRKFHHFYFFLLCHHFGNVDVLPVSYQRFISTYHYYLINFFLTTREQNLTTKPFSTSSEAKVSSLAVVYLPPGGFLIRFFYIQLRS